VKKFILGLFVFLFTLSLQVSAGGGDAFPWGSELPFPWKSIQGTWSTEIEGIQAYVIFKVVRPEAAGSRQLKINIVDADTCRVIAVGAGYEDNRIVKAIVTGGNRASQITVHAFREADVRAQTRNSNNYKENSQVTIMSSVPINSSQKRSAYELVKISSDFRPPCL
jgi:hypothetical protein